MEADATPRPITHIAGAGTNGPAPARVVTLVLAIGLQSACAVFFLADVIGDLTAGDAEGNSIGHNAVELAATLGLVLGIVFLVRELRRLLARQARMAAQIEVASGAFHALLESSFEEWELTPAERDVALLLIKGLSIAQIAGLRGSADGTVKAHCNKVYSKAGVAGRNELVSYFIEDLMGESLIPPAARDEALSEAAATR